MTHLAQCRMYVNAKPTRQQRCNLTAHASKSSGITPLPPPCGDYKVPDGNRKRPSTSLAFVWYGNNRLACVDAVQTKSHPDAANITKHLQQMFCYSLPSSASTMVLLSTLVLNCIMICGAPPPVFWPVLSSLNMPMCLPINSCALIRALFGVSKSPALASRC